MSASCKTCVHWRDEKSGARPVRLDDVTVRNCTAQPPKSDYHWPRTMEHQVCGMHQAPFFAEAREQPLEVAPIAPPSPEVLEAFKADLAAVGISPLLPASPVQTQVADLLSQVETPPPAVPKSKRRNG